MKLIDKEIYIKSESDVFTLFPIGDVHMGTKNCAEGHLKRYIEHIKNTPCSAWIGGGDYCECIKPSDVKRYDVRALPDWLFTGDACNIKDALSDIALQQRNRFTEMVDPIKDTCIGLIQGNHEQTLMQYSNNAHHFVMCNELGATDLTDAAFIRFRFIRGKKGGTKHSVASVTLAILHGTGGGRTAGAEPNHLDKLSRFFEADIILRGHSHSFNITPPQTFLYVPRKGAMPDELMSRETYKANWGCWVKSYSVGAPTYDSRANYPARPLQSMEIRIKPFHTSTVTVMGRKTTRQTSKITIRECDYE